ncbi:MAG: glycogen synthase [Desulfobacterales bacterium]|jgi:glycogen synthase|nr:glycogen synthase [Desulfobacterales bacterium]
MRILMISNEYPPNIYGGAGVHVDYLCRELVRLCGNVHSLRVLCFGDQQEIADNLSVAGVGEMPALFEGATANRKVMDTLGRNIAMAARAAHADLVHCHTWYTYLAGCLVKQFLDIPLVITVHSLEPKRPWKREQIGSGYSVSSWLEKTAMENADGIIAVSNGMKSDIIDCYKPVPEKIRVIYNGIDIAHYRKTLRPEVLDSYGISPFKSYILFVGRITRQKGIIHLVRALPYIEEGVQIVLCAGAPDTEAILGEMQAAVEGARAATANDIIWIPEMIPRESLSVLYSHAALFVCPSVYEPFGIINLEAMACGTPVVASAVGGIPEVVLHDRTGLLVPFDPISDADPEPCRPDLYARDLAGAVNQLLRDPQRRSEMGTAGRKRVETIFGWEAIARQTLDYYNELLSARPDKGEREQPTDGT